MRLSDHEIRGGQGRRQHRGCLILQRLEDSSPFRGRPRQDHFVKRGAYGSSRFEGVAPFAAAAESTKEQGGWLETILNPQYRKGAPSPDHPPFTAISLDRHLHPGLVTVTKTTLE
ncbi:MAG: DUF6330 family protein [Pelagibaca sp.]